MHQTVHVSHHSKGRTRIRLEAHKHDEAFLDELKSQLLARPGVKHVKVNPITGSLLILHDYELEALVEEIESHTILRFAVTSLHETRLGQAIEHDLLKIDRKLLNWTGGTFDLISAGFLVGLGAWVVKASGSLKWIAALVA